MHHPFRRVNYSTKAPEVDFFRFPGQLPKAKFQRTWLMDDLGRQSSRLKDALSNLEEWRTELWRLFDASATTKLTDWQHEEEFRIVVSDLIGNKRENRHATYYKPLKSWSENAAKPSGPTSSFLRSVTRDRRARSKSCR